MRRPAALAVCFVAGGTSGAAQGPPLPFVEANADASGSHGQIRVIDPEGRIVDEASIFDEEMLTAAIDLSRATRSLPLGSLRRGPLGVGGAPASHACG